MLRTMEKKNSFCSALISHFSCLFTDNKTKACSRAGKKQRTIVEGGIFHTHRKALRSEPASVLAASEIEIDSYQQLFLNCLIYPSLSRELSLGPSVE